MAAAAGTANAAEPVTETIELPTLTADLSAQIAQSADATAQTADSYEARAQQDAAAVKAAKQAAKDQAEAEKKAEARKKAEAKAKAEREAAQERAARDSERTQLSTSSAPSGSGSSASQSSSSNSAPSGSVGTVISFLKAQLGDAYVMGASGPNAWDCSSLVQAAFKQVGVDLPRVSQAQSTAGTPVSLSNLQVGDILYWGGAGSAYHVGVYIGNGQYLDAANPGKGVVIQDLSGYPASGAVRVL
ncbi:glycoside hydrolase [Streptomyces alboflavus]|uniref:Glycoside hydrolase n=1 Tax=Streptomyces alboflavus TaxID=67267 RepID=A0A1Z1WGV7_9ACTN|nr:glycoside hydrolase [Streptomyces alboflavus]